MKKYLFLTGVGLAIFSGCKPTEVDPKADYKPILTNVSNDVILPTYQDLFEKTDALLTTLATLENNPSVANLEAARQAWRDARSPWEQCEGFLFGPVEQKGLDPSIDSWPVNQPDLDNVLASSAVLTKEYVDGLDGTLKGFHTIEYLVFGTTGNKQVSDFTPRQFEYLKACAQSLHGATEALYYSWKPDQQNFIKNVLEAGEAGNSFYPSQKAALQEFVQGFITIADEVANGKIQEPFSQQNPALEESRFSANSKKDFSDNIRSIKNGYIGIYKNTSGRGVSELISSKNAALDTKVKQQIEEAISAIEAIPGTFTAALSSNPTAIQNAQTKVRTLQMTLESEVLPIISNL